MRVSEAPKAGSYDFPGTLQGQRANMRRSSGASSTKSILLHLAPFGLNPEPSSCCNAGVQSRAQCTLKLQASSPNLHPQSLNEERIKVAERFAMLICCCPQKCYRQSAPSPMLMIQAPTAQSTGRSQKVEIPILDYATPMPLLIKS